MTLNLVLTQTYTLLSNIAGSDHFWQTFESSFGLQYNRTIAETLRLQWHNHDFSQLPKIEILDSSILSNANGAYASSSNKIYLSADFVAYATPEAINAVLLEEIGHFIDAQINGADSQGDEGEIFSRLVRGQSLDAPTVATLQQEDDHAMITLNGESVQIEENVSTLAFQESQKYFTTYDQLDKASFENVRTIDNTNFTSNIALSDGYRARFKNITINNVANTPYTPIPFATGTNPNTTNPTTITPLSSTVKGLIIHTANNLPAVPNPWGAHNLTEADLMLKTLATNAAGNRYLLAEDKNSGAAKQEIGRLSHSQNPIASQKQPIEVTLVWTGPATHDLDVWLEPASSPGTKILPTLTGTDTGNNSSDNYEQIYFTPDRSDTYKVYVGKAQTSSNFESQDFSVFFTAKNIVGQGHGWGDVHLQTFDRKSYDLQSVGEFILVESLIDDFEVQTRQKAWNNSSTVSVNTAFATTIDGYSVVYDAELPVGQELQIDGQSFSLTNGNSVNLGNSKIQRQGNRYTFTYAGPDGTLNTSDDDKLTADDNGSYLNVSVDPADYRGSLLQGLLGNGDGNSTNDFALRDGTSLGASPSAQVLHTTFADSWRINEQESLFITPVYQVPNFPSQYISLNTLAKADPNAVADAFDLARTAGIPEGDFLNGAVLDFVVTGDQSFINGAKAAADFAQQGENGAIPLGGIQGSKWNDLDGNGIWDAGEPALGGVTIFIDSIKNGQLDLGEISTVTSQDGTYSFSNLGPGEYTLAEVVQSGWEQTYPTESYSIDLKTGQITGSPNPNITLTSVPTDSNQDGYYEAVVKLNYEEALDQVKFVVEYDAIPTGWTVDIGDSFSNNGYGGDGGDTSNAAETEIVGQAMHVYSNTLPGYESEVIDGNVKLLGVPNIVSGNGSKLILEVGDEYLGWDNLQAVKGNLESPYLYTLNGQATTYGPVNYDLYASFNRVIDGNYRFGTGASQITIIPVNTATQKVTLAAGETATNINFGNRDTLNLDTTAPTASSFTPADNATGVAVDANLVVNFSETIQKGTTGNIVIKKLSDNSVVETIAVTAANVTVSGSQLTINPTSDLVTGTDYYIAIADGAITDIAGNNYAGITGKSTWNFTTEGFPPINGTANDDSLTGTANSEIINGLGGNDKLLGNGGNDTLNGGAGIDTLNGGAGSDELVGGAGNDTYLVGTGDTVTELAAGGNDLVRSSITYTLPTNVERLTLAGTSAINGTGNNLANRINGNSAENTLKGATGNDLLIGNGGADQLLGGEGNDSLNGGAGNDTLTGGNGADQFIYNTNAAFTKAAVGVDTITDFTVAQSDRIVLAQTTFTSISSVAGSGFSVAGEFAKVTTDALAATRAADIVYNTATGGLFYNPNGTAAGFGTGGKFLTLTNKPALTASQFLIQA